MTESWGENSIMGTQMLTLSQLKAPLWGTCMHTCLVCLAFHMPMPAFLRGAQGLPLLSLGPHNTPVRLSDSGWLKAPRKLRG